MEWAIIGSHASLNEVSFSPSIAVGFYQNDCEQELLSFYDLMKKRYPETDVIGCSAESVIGDKVPFYDPDRPQPVVFILLAIPKEAYSVTIVNHDSPLPDSIQAGFGAMLFGSSNYSGFETLLETLRDRLHPHALVGAIASGGNGALGPSTLFHNGRFVKDANLLWLIDASRYTVKGRSVYSFEPVGISLTITAVRGREILEIENAPALDMIERVIGKLNPESLATADYPLFIATKDSQYASQTQAPLASLVGIDRQKGSLTVLRYPEIGDSIRIALPMSRNEHAAQIEKLANEMRGDNASLLFSCFAYKSNWGKMEPVFYMHLATRLGEGFAGFHAAGEIGPLGPHDLSRLQNQTLTLVTISEKAN